MRSCLIEILFVLPCSNEEGEYVCSLFGMSCFSFNHFFFLSILIFFQLTFLSFCDYSFVWFVLDRPVISYLYSFKTDQDLKSLCLITCQRTDKVGVFFFFFFFFARQSIFDVCFRNMCPLNEKSERSA